jgi:hypothetical protein
MTTAAKELVSRTSATDCSRARKLGCKPLSSTIRPNSAATISSRAIISTLPNDASRKIGDKQFGNLRTFRNRQHAASLSRRYYWEQMSTLQTPVRAWRKLLPNKREPTLREYDEGVAGGTRGPAQTARRSDVSARRCPEAGRQRSAPEKCAARRAHRHFQAAVEFPRGIFAAAESRSV